MFGYPKTLNSKFDYEYVRRNFPREIWEQSFKELLCNRMQCFNIGKLDSAENGINDATHKIIENEHDGIKEYYQYELREDPNCSLLRFGFTVEEVEKILAGA